MTVKTRITLFIVGAGFISSLLFSIVIFYELMEQPYALLDRQLKEEALRTTAIVVKAQTEGDTKRMETVLLEIYQYWIEIHSDVTHESIFQSNLATSVRLPQVNPGSKAIVRPLVSEGKDDLAPMRNQDMPYRVRTLSIELGGRSYIVQIARPMVKLHEEIWELIFGILAGLLFSTLVLVVISRFLASKILHPIGEMKSMAQNIHEKNLEQRIPIEGAEKDEFSELARTINQMLDRLQYSFMRQRDFLFDTSHELKTPLTTIRLAVDEIACLDDDKLTSPVRHNLLRLKNQVLRMERLVKDLLNLSSLETLSTIEAHPVEISKLLLSLVEEYRFLADSRKIEMDIRFPKGIVIQADGKKLNRAFSNILDNAIKYNEKGGRVELTGNISASGLTVMIGNTGPGVAEAETSKIFDQFYRVEKSRSTEHGGSGLGLSIVKRIVELHGGSVKFESNIGQWSRLTVTLP